MQYVVRVFHGTPNVMWCHFWLPRDLHLSSAGGPGQTVSYWKLLTEIIHYYGVLHWKSHIFCVYFLKNKSFMIFFKLRSTPFMAHQCVTEHQLTIAALDFLFFTPWFPPLQHLYFKTQSNKVGWLGEEDWMLHWRRGRGTQKSKGRGGVMDQAAGGLVWEMLQKEKQRVLCGVA